MTILCPHQFYQAVQHAAEADAALDARILSSKDKAAAHVLESKRGQATRTLMSCFGYRANSDYMDNKDPHYPDGSEIVMPNGAVNTAFSLGKDNLPEVDTFVYDDLSQYSFFFREVFLDKRTRQRVDVYDRCWYLFPGLYDRGKVAGMSDEELDAVVSTEGSGVTRTFCSDYMESAVASDSSIIVHETMKKRVGMCGGIIYHPDWIDGEMMPFGSYSTHT